MRFILAICFTTLILSAGAVEKVYVPFFSSEDCSHQLRRSSTYILVDLINYYGSFEAIAAQKRDTGFFEEPIDEIKESAELLGTPYYLVGKIIRIDDTYHVSATLYATSSGMTIWSDIRSTNDLNDIPAIMDEFAYHLGSNKKMSQAGDVFRVYSAESNRIKREKSNKGIGVIAGAMVPFSNEEIENVNGGFGLIGSFDARNFILQLSAEVYYGKDSIPSGFIGHEFQNRYYNIGASVLYPLSTTNNAPFVTLGSGFTYRETQVRYDPVFYNNPRLSSHEHDFVHTGLSVNGGGGYILKRNSDATLFIYARFYAFIPSLNSISYGALLNLAVTIGG